MRHMADAAPADCDPYCERLRLRSLGDGDHLQGDEGSNSGDHDRPASNGGNQRSLKLPSLGHLRLD